MSSRRRLQLDKYLHCINLDTVHEGPKHRLGVARLPSYKLVLVLFESGPVFPQVENLHVLLGLA